MGAGLGIMPWASAAVGAVAFLILLWTSWVSRAEGEPQAAVRLGLMAVLLPAWFVIPIFLPESFGVPLASVLVGLVIVAALALTLPFPGRGLKGLGQPVRGVDE